MITRVWVQTVSDHRADLGRLATRIRLGSSAPPPSQAVPSRRVYKSVYRTGLDLRIPVVPAARKRTLRPVGSSCHVGPPIDVGTGYHERRDQRNREHLVRYHQNALARLGIQVTVTPPGDGTPPPQTPDNPGHAA